MSSSKVSVLLITAILALVATVIFIFLLDATILALMAYIFTLLGIMALCAGKLFLLNNTRGYPWTAAFPLLIWRYLTLQVVLSAIFLIAQNVFGMNWPLGLFIVIQVILAAVFAIYLISLKAGKDYIDQRGAEVKQKVSILRLMQTDVESIMRQHPEHEKDLKRVAEALRYSDPMSHSSLGAYDADIQRSISSMTGLEGNDPANIPKICETLLKQIADRNSKVKLMK